MKELNIEQKAKAYDEVRKKIATRFGSNVAEEIFSQFEMSDDERIRKALIYHYQGDGCLCTNEYRMDYKEIRAWLEKQGKNNMGISEATKQKLENNLNKALEKETSKSWNEFLEKQGKQKPIDSTFEIKPKFKVGDTIRELETGNLFYVNSIEDFGYTLHYKNCNANGCTMSFRYEDNYELVRQKPAGWSEEDEEHIKRIIEHFEGRKKDLKTQWVAELHNKEITWLKSLKDRVQPQPKQEWGEEDETKLKSACALIRNTSLNGNEGIVDSTITFLKSLKDRYTWKPSDEQMDALYTYIYNPQHFNSPDPRMEIVESVYKDLKKLREE